MSDTDHEQTESVNPSDSDATEPGFVHIAEQPDATPLDASAASIPSTDARPATPLSSQVLERAGTVEHLAARRSAPALDTSAPAIKQRLSELRTEVTRLLTSLRWEDQSIDDTAEQLIPLLSVGSVQQWKPVLIPFLYEIDRGGVMIPVWLNIIERGDPTDLPHDANPAETMLGRARRFSILMLGNYRVMGISSLDSGSRLSRGEANLTQFLGTLLTDPNTSMYAAQALVKHATMPAMQVLVGALKDVKGWAKIDVIEGCLALKQERFYDLLLTTGLDNIPGLESYAAIPLYRAIPLENYLRGREGDPRLQNNAALIFNQVLLDSMTPPAAGSEVKTLPVAFEGQLTATAHALFASTRSNPTWQSTVAVHRLGIFLGIYWKAISQGGIKDVRIVEPVYHCLPMMNDVEHWMAGPGRDMLLSVLSDDDEKALGPAVKVLGELRDPRATMLLITRIENTKDLRDRAHALTLGTVCDTLGALGDRRAVAPMHQLVHRTIDIARRADLAKRRDNLTPGDADIPGSIVYAAVIRASGRLSDRYALEGVVGALHDFDPYVRTQAIEAIRSLDPNGEDVRSRAAVREALDDPREAVMRTACQLVVQYRDSEAVPSLRRVVEARPDVAYLAHNALRQLGQ